VPSDPLVGGRRARRGASSRYDDADAARCLARSHTRAGLALESPDANGRYLLAVPEVSIQQMALWLKQTPTMAHLPIPTWRMPAFVLYAVALFDSRISFRWAWEHAGTHLQFDASRVKQQLRLEFRPTDDTIRDTAAEMIDRGLVRYVRCCTLVDGSLTHQHLCSELSWSRRAACGRWRSACSRSVH